MITPKKIDRKRDHEGGNKWSNALVLHDELKIVMNNTRHVQFLAKSINFRTRKEDVMNIIKEISNTAEKILAKEELMVKFIKKSGSGWKQDYIAKRFRNYSSDDVNCHAFSSSEAIDKEDSGLNVKSSITSLTTPRYYPKPANGSVYQLPEAIGVYNNIKCLKDRNNFVRYACTNKRIPVDRRTFIRRVASHANGDLVRQWNLPKGRHPLMTISECKQLVENINERKGLSLTKTTMKNILMERKSHKENSVICTVSKSSTDRYISTLMCCGSDVTVRTKVQQKDRNRLIAEHSIRSCVSYLMTVAVTHYRIVKKKIPSISNATIGATTLYDMVQACNSNNNLAPVSPWLITSTDDSTLFVFRGIKKTQEKLYVCGKRDESGKLSNFNGDTGGTDKLSGVRVRHTHTINAYGNTAPIYITMYGLNDRELPVSKNPDGMLVLKIPGLCIGAGQDIRLSNVIGYVIFLRNDQKKEGEYTLETKNFDYYRNKVYLPYIETLRQKYNKNFDVMDDNNDDTVVSWYDGGPSQLSLLINEKTLQNNDERMIVSCKHAAASTAVQQAADVSPIFRSIRTISDKMTSIDMPNRAYKQNVHKIFKDAQKNGLINLKPTAENAFIDHIVSCPDIFSRSINNKAILQGFLSNGMIDRKQLNWPDFNSILGTCRRKITHEEVSLIKNTFSVLYKEMDQKGYISEEKFDELNYPVDKDENNLEVRRNAKITDEKSQRAKILSHKFQRSLRQKIIHEKSQKEMRNMRENNKTCADKLETSKECVNILLENTNIVDESNALNCLEFVDFKKPSKKQLQCFIFVRTRSALKQPKNNNLIVIPKNKGTVAEAVNGYCNLIRMAYDIRDHPIMLQLPSCDSNSSSANPTVDIDSIEEPNITECGMNTEGSNSVEINELNDTLTGIHTTSNNNNQFPILNVPPNEQTPSPSFPLSIHGKKCEFIYENCKTKSSITVNTCPKKRLLCEKKQTVTRLPVLLHNYTNENLTLRGNSGPAFPDIPKCPTTVKNCPIGTLESEKNGKTSGCSVSMHNSSHKNIRSRINGDHTSPVQPTSPLFFVGKSQENFMVDNMHKFKGTSAELTNRHENECNSRPAQSGRYVGSHNMRSYNLGGSEMTDGVIVHGQSLNYRNCEINEKFFLSTKNSKMDLRDLPSNGIHPVTMGETTRSKDIVNDRIQVDEISENSEHDMVEVSKCFLG